MGLEGRAHAVRAGRALGPAEPGRQVASFARATVAWSPHSPGSGGGVGDGDDATEVAHLVGHGGGPEPQSANTTSCSGVWSISATATGAWVRCGVDPVLLPAAMPGDRHLGADPLDLVLACTNFSQARARCSGRARRYRLEPMYVGHGGDTPLVHPQRPTAACPGRPPLVVAGPTSDWALRRASCFVTRRPVPDRPFPTLGIEVGLRTPSPSIGCVGPVRTGSRRAVPTRWRRVRDGLSGRLHPAAAAGVGRAAGVRLPRRRHQRPARRLRQGRGPATVHQAGTRRCPSWPRSGTEVLGKFGECMATSGPARSSAERAYDANSTTCRWWHLGRPSARVAGPTSIGRLQALFSDCQRLPSRGTSRAAAERHRRPSARHSPGGRRGIIVPSDLQTRNTSRRAAFKQVPSANRAWGYDGGGRRGGDRPCAEVLTPAARWPSWWAGSPRPAAGVQVAECSVPGWPRRCWQGRAVRRAAVATGRSVCWHRPS